MLRHPITMYLFLNKKDDIPLGICCKKYRSNFYLAINLQQKLKENPRNYSTIMVEKNSIENIK